MDLLSGWDQAYLLKLLATSDGEVILGPGLYLLGARVEGAAFTGGLPESAARAGLRVEQGLLSRLTILKSLCAGTCPLPSSQPHRDTAFPHWKPLQPERREGGRGLPCLTLRPAQSPVVETSGLQGWAPERTFLVTRCLPGKVLVKGN